MECMWDGSEAMDAVSAREDVEVAAAPRRETDFWNGVSPPPDSSSGLYPFDWVCAVTALRLLLDAFLVVVMCVCVCVFRKSVEAEVSCVQKKRDRGRRRCRIE